MMYSARCWPDFVSSGGRRDGSSSVHSGEAKRVPGGSVTVSRLAFAIAAALALTGSQVDAARATTLEEVVSLAISTHPTVKKAQAGKRAADEEVDEARADFFPTLDVVGEVGYEYTDNFFTRSQTENGSGTEELARKLVVGEARQNLFQGFGQIQPDGGGEGTCQARQSQFDG